MFKKVFNSIVIVALMLAMGSLTVAAKGPGPGSGGGGGGGKGGGGGGGGGEIPDTGTLYGDLYVILRDVNGVPIFDANGCMQPIAAEDAVGEVVIYDSTDPDKVLFQTTAIPGEPFALAFYADVAAELEVECELTPEMADWVMTVDFGRLNMGRAPEHVIAHAFDEAVNKMNDAIEISLDPAGRLVLTFEDGSVKTIDAPAENLALYIAMMTGGDWYTEDTTPIVMGQPPTDMGPPEGDGPSTEPRPVLNTNAIGHLKALGFTNLGDPYDGVIGAGDLNNQELLLAASLLAAAADKTGSISLDKVVYINFIYGINQLGTLTDGKPDGRTYFDFSNFTYGRSGTYGSRSSGGCPDGWIWVLQPTGTGNNYAPTCMEIMGWTNNPTVNSVRFFEMTEAYKTVEDAEGNLLKYDFVENVRAFTQAADDALQVLEYIHNYKVPEVLVDEDAALAWLQANTTITGTLDDLTATFPIAIPQEVVDEPYQINSRMTLAAPLPEGSLITVERDGVEVVSDYDLGGATEFWFTDLLGLDLLDYSAPFDAYYGVAVENYVITIIGTDIDTELTIQSIISKDGFDTKVVLAETVVPVVPAP